MSSDAIYTGQPPRECPELADPNTVVEAIGAAVSLRDEPEAISGAWVDGYAQVAAFHRTQQHRLDVTAARISRELLAAEDRIVDAQRRAKTAHRRDLSGEFRLAREMNERFKRSVQREDVHLGSGALTSSPVGGTPAPLSRLLRRIESDLDGLPLEDAA